MKETNTHGATEGTQQEPSAQCDNKETPSLSSKQVYVTWLDCVFINFISFYFLSFCAINMKYFSPLIIPLLQFFAVLVT